MTQILDKSVVNSKSEMQALAQKIAAQSEVGDVFLLKGTLGAGKSFFAKNFINFLQEKNREVLSPTFNLVYSYDSKKGEIFHFDLYRLKSADELENIGFFDALENGICLIEWPEIAAKFFQPNLKKNVTEIEIIFGDKNSEEQRQIIISQISKR